MNDTGDRREFGTGAVRDTADGKGWYAGISPIALRRLALVLQKGAAKYAPRNWEKGLPLNSPFDSAIRHLFQWAAGEVDEDHLGHAMCNVMFLIHLEEKIARGDLPRELQDMGPIRCLQTLPAPPDKFSDPVEMSCTCLRAEFGFHTDECPAYRSPERKYVSLETKEQLKAFMDANKANQKK